MSGSYLTFGSLPLDGISPDGMYELRVLGAAHGTNITSGPAAITATMQSFVQDGAIVATTGHENRTLPVAVQVTDGPLADKGEGVPIGADALVAQCRATWDGTVLPLRWVPSDGLGPPCVFEVTAADLGEADFNGAMEVDPANLGTVYLLSLTCNPWAFADSPVTVTIPAPTASDPVTPTVTVVDDCDYDSPTDAAAAGWAVGPANDLQLAGTTSGGNDSVVSYQATAQDAPATVQLIRSFPDGLNMASTPYLLVTVEASYKSGSSPVVVVPTFVVNGVQTAPVAANGMRYWVPAPATVSTLTMSLTIRYITSVKVRCYDLSRTDMVAAAALTQHEVSRQFDVQGSVRVPASITARGVNVADQSDAALGQTVVYVSRSQGAAGPALRGVLQAGPVQTTDTTAYSGKTSPLSTQHTFLLPVSSVASAGYDVLARVRAATTGSKTFGWTAGTLVNGAAVDAGLSGSVTISIAAANTWQTVDLASFPLPVTQAGSAGQVQVTLVETDAAKDTVIDEGWLCDVDNGALTVVDAGASTRMWIDTASFTTPMPLIWVGTAADRSDAYVPGAKILSFMQPTIEPPVVNVFAAAANPVELSMTSTPAGHTRAPRVRAA